MANNPGSTGFNRVTSTLSTPVSSISRKKRFGKDIQRSGRSCQGYRFRDKWRLNQSYGDVNKKRKKRLGGAGVSQKNREYIKQFQSVLSLISRKHRPWQLGRKAWYKNGIDKYEGEFSVQWVKMQCGVCRIKRNEELKQLCREPKMKRGRLQWAGHLQGLPKERVPKTIFQWRKAWLNDPEEDLRRTGVRIWRG